MITCQHARVVGRNDNTCVDCMERGRAAERAEIATYCERNWALALSIDIRNGVHTIDEHVAVKEDAPTKHEPGKSDCGCDVCTAPDFHDGDPR